MAGSSEWLLLDGGHAGTRVGARCDTYLERRLFGRDSIAARSLDAQRRDRHARPAGRRALAGLLPRLDACSQRRNKGTRNALEARRQCSHGSARGLAWSSLVAAWFSTRLATGSNDGGPALATGRLRRR